MTKTTSSEPADLVDEYRAPFVRPLGNLVILYANAESALRELWADLNACTEVEAGKFLDGISVKTSVLDFKRRITARAKEVGIPGHLRKDLSRAITNYYTDRNRRNRLIHDEWHVSLPSKLRAVTRTRGLPRKKVGVVWGNPKPDLIWKLAGRFREYCSLFTDLKNPAFRKPRQ